MLDTARVVFSFKQKGLNEKISCSEKIAGVIKVGRVRASVKRGQRICWGGQRISLKRAFVNQSVLQELCKVKRRNTQFSTSNRKVYVNTFVSIV